MYWFQFLEIHEYAKPAHVWRDSGKLLYHPLCIISIWSIYLIITNFLPHTDRYLMLAVTLNVECFDA
jgi:hypothetical protein